MPILIEELRAIINDPRITAGSILKISFSTGQVPEGLDVEFYGLEISERGELQIVASADIEDNFDEEEEEDDDDF